MIKPPLEPEYPFYDHMVWVTRCGRIFLERRKINLSQDFAGQILGIREIDGGVGLVRFLDYAIGFSDRDEDRVKPGPNHFAPEKVLTMSPEYTVNHMPGTDRDFLVSGVGFEPATFRL